MTKAEAKRQKIAWLRRHKQYESRNYKNFRLAIQKMSLDVPWDKTTETNYKRVITEHFKDVTPMYEAVLDIHLNAGKKEYRYQRKKIDEIKAKLVTKQTPLFNAELVRLIADNLLTTGGSRIVSMTKTLAKFLINVLADLLENQQITYPIAVDRILKDINDPNYYRYQIERIVRTETTQASQYTALMAMDDPDIYIDKMWLSVDDDRTRNGTKGRPYNHLGQNGTVKRLKDVFNIEVYNEPSEPLLYPGDPSGSAGNVINCRCGLGRVVRRDKNGRVVMKTEPDILQQAVKKKTKDEMTLAEFEQAIYKLKHEESALYGLNGKQLYWVKGTKSQVSYTDEQLELWKGRIMTHNHPGGSPLSRQDLGMAMHHKLKEIRAVGIEAIYSMKIKKHGLSFGQVVARYDIATNIVEQKFESNNYNNEVFLTYEVLNERQKNIYFQRLIMAEFMKIFDNNKYFTYEEKRR
jgi:hypothetical protein